MIPDGRPGTHGSQLWVIRIMLYCAGAHEPVRLSLWYVTATAIPRCIGSCDSIEGARKDTWLAAGLKGERTDCAL